MVLWTPTPAAVNVIRNGGTVGSTTFGTGVPSSATTLNYGTVTEVISAANNTQNSWGIEIYVWNTGLSAAASEASIDILIGGATDDVLISSLLVGGTFASSTRQYFFPIHIPGGVRIAARLASVRTSITPRVLIYLYGGITPPFQVGRKVTTYGTKINNARGQAVTPTASGGAAAVTEMTAASTEDHFYFAPGFQCATDTTMAERTYAVGIGAGTSTEERIGTWWFQASTTEQMSGMFPVCWTGFWDVPAGTRLSLLTSNSGTNDTAYDGHVYAVS